MDDLNTIKYADFVSLVTIKWNEGRDSITPVMRSSGLYRNLPKPDHTGESDQFSETDNELFLHYKPQGEEAKRIRDIQGFKKTGTIKRYAGEKKIEYELWHYNKYPDVLSKIFNLGSQGENTIERDLSHVFTFGGDANYVDADGQTRDLTTGDGLSAFNVAHTMKATGKTFSNVLTPTTFSETALEALEALRLLNTFNHFGQKLQTKDNILWSGDDPATVHEINRVLKSSTFISQENPGVISNYNGKYKHVIIPYLATDVNGGPDSTKAKYWGVASSMHSQFVFSMNEAPHLKMPSKNQEGTVAEDFSTDAIKIGSRAGYMIVLVAPYGHAICKAT